MTLDLDPSTDLSFTRTLAVPRLPASQALAKLSVSVPPEGVLNKTCCKPLALSRAVISSCAKA